MKTKIDQSRPACRLSGLGRERWISRHTRDMKFLQDQIGFCSEPTRMPWFQDSRSFIEPAKHIKESYSSGLVKGQLGRQLQEHWAALFSECACLLQKALQSIMALDPQFSFMGDGSRSFYCKTESHWN